MTDSDKDLTQRLRQYLNSRYEVTMCYNGLRDEAADRIEELVESNKELTLQLLATQGQAADALDRAMVAEAKLTKAIEALRPFSKAAKAWEPDDGDSALGARIEHPHHGLERHAEFTFGDLRRARAVLAELEGGKE
jgi:hypothetical protein